MAQAGQLSYEQMIERIGLHIAKKEYDSAVTLAESMHRAIPARIEPLKLLMIVYSEAKRYESLILVTRHAIGMAPQDAELYSYLARALDGLGRTSEVALVLKKAASISPNNERVNATMASFHLKNGRLQEALACYQKLLQINPKNVSYYKECAKLLIKAEAFQDAATMLEKAVEICPPEHCDFKALHQNLIVAYTPLKDYDGVQRVCDTLLQSDPNDPFAINESIYSCRVGCDWPKHQKLVKQLYALYPFDRYTVQTPFLNTLESDNLLENLSCAKYWAGAIYHKSSRAFKPPVFEADKRLPSCEKIRIGYVSNDFRNHATMHLMRGVFGHHNKDDFEVFIYSYGYDDGSSYRKDLEAQADTFFDAQKISSQALAERIYHDNLDLLIDLKGFTNGVRFDAMYHKPAPIIATYLGYPGTTGMEFFDYTIVDKTIVPEDHAAYYSEKPAYLPNSYQANDNQQVFDVIDTARADHNLPENTFIYASFNQSYKITPQMFECWCDILKKAKSSILWLEGANEKAKANLQKQAEQHGVDSSRLYFYDYVRKDYHLNRLKLADLCLDTDICNGHTTTSDALWSGVPVITKIGGHFSSRVGASLLRAVEMPELITDNFEDYKNLAIRLATNSKEMQALKKKLRFNRDTTALYNTEGFTRDLESLYKAMVSRYKAGETPTALHFKQNKVIQCDAVEKHTKQRVINAHWYAQTPNWGDAVNRELMGRISGKDVVWHEPYPDGYTEYHLCTGSILALATKNAIVWGSGYISEEARFVAPPKAIHAVRGPLTRNLLLAQGVECPEVYGDPALLYPRFYHPRVKAKYDLGIVAHYIDQDAPWMLKLQQNLPDNIKILNIKTDNINGFVDELLQCKQIASSSLHGLIAADAYGIPSTWLRFSDKVVGGYFKFHDYFASVGRKDKAPLQMYESTAVEQVMDQFYSYKVDIDLDKLLAACPFRSHQ